MESQAQINVRAFLDTIAFSEGTFGKGDNGYNILFGGGLFKDYSKHPQKKIRRKLGSTYITSSAAGRYQILGKYADAYTRILKLKDFSPICQDAIAIQMIREQSALKAVQNGDFDRAVKLCANIWASFPGAGYGQPEHRIQVLRDFYQKSGGRLASVSVT